MLLHTTRFVLLFASKSCTMMCFLRAPLQGNDGAVVVYNSAIVSPVDTDGGVGPVQFENKVRDGEEHGVGDHDEAEERAQSLEGGRRHLLFTASHVCQSVSESFLFRLGGKR